MGGRRCVIIRNAMNIPDTAPSNPVALRLVDALVRKAFENPAIAGELDNEPDFTPISTALAKTPGTLTQVEVQMLLAKINGIPPTD